MLKHRALISYLLVVLFTLSCQTSDQPNLNTATPPDDGLAATVKQAHDAEVRYEQEHKLEDLVFALHQYHYAAKERTQYLFDVLRLTDTLRKNDKDRLYSFDVLEDLLDLYYVYPESDDLRSLLEEAYQPYVDKNRAEFKIEPYLRYRPRDILRRQPRSVGLKHIRNLYCTDE